MTGLTRSSLAGRFGGVCKPSKNSHLRCGATVSSASAKEHLRAASPPPNPHRVTRVILGTPSRSNTRSHMAATQARAFHQAYPAARLLGRESLRVAHGRLGVALVQQAHARARPPCWMRTRCRAGIRLARTMRVAVPLRSANPSTRSGSLESEGMTSPPANSPTSASTW